MPKPFDFSPDPTHDSLSECIRAGWAYPYDIIDPLEGLNLLNGMSQNDRSVERAEELLNSSERQAVYVLGSGVVFAVSRDLDGHIMLLTSLDKGVRNITPRNTYTEADRVLG